jgi:hypothetical protein
MFDSINFADPSTQIVSVLVGIAVLLLGRRLFWLFVGAVGFVLGLNLAFQLLTDQPEWLVVVAALVVGLIGAILAIFAQKVAVIIAGFIIGGSGLLWVLQLLGLDPGGWALVVFAVGAIIGAIVIASLFEAALIALSSLTGAALITQVINQAFQFNALVVALIFVALLAVGIIVQAQMWDERSPA